tara:strand:+ start:218 stop:724 length:507 start_codon:yes stop_codon:yes gene_type:complete
MYDRNELEKIFIKKKGVSDGDWLLRVQSSPFFVADRYGFDLKSSIIISKDSITEFVENADSDDTRIYFWLNWGDQIRFGVLAEEVNEVYYTTVRILRTETDCNYNSNYFKKFDDKDTKKDVSDVLVLNLSMFDKLSVSNPIWEENTERMNIIGQNGNDGLHYEELEDE